MCVCVLEILVLKTLKLKDYFERLLCWLDHWLSWMLGCIHVCVFLLSKNCFEKLAWHLLDTLLFVKLLKRFSYRNLDSSSILGGSIDKAPASSIAPWHLVDRSSFCSWIWFIAARYLLDTSAIKDHFLDTYLDTSRYLICRALLKVLFKLPSRSVSHFFDLSWSIHDCSSHKHSPFHSKPLP